jgi:hypothetical protein
MKLFVPASRSCLLLTWILTLSCLSSGCAYYTARPLEASHKASSVIDQREAQGLYVAVKDLSHTSDSLKYFDRDLLEMGYVPVLVMLELDQSSNAVFDVRNSDLRLCLQDGLRLTPADLGQICDEAAFSHTRSAMGFLLLLPGFFIASSVNTANDDLESDYREKCLNSIRVNPNARSFRGVVFFELPEERREDFTMEEAFVEAKVYLGGTQSNLGQTLEFPVHFGR